TDVKNMWSEDNIDTDLPKFYYGDQVIKKNITRSNNAATAVDNNSSRFYEKANYLALRELTLAYTLPGAWTSKVNLSSVRVNVTGQNLAYFTKYTGTSPEAGVSDGGTIAGLDAGRYPLPRTLLF